MTHNSCKGWKTIRKLSIDHIQPSMSSQCKPSCTPAPSQWQRHHAIQVEASCITPATEGDYSMVYPFSQEEYRKGVAILKNNKASGRDDVLVEQLNNLGPKAHRWLLTIINNCFMENKIPTLWRQSKIIAMLKPGKDYTTPKSYRPISLLCHTYKLYERMILNRIATTIEQHLIKEQAGFRPGKSCTSQLLNLTQHIEDDYQENMITGTSFVDLSAAYNTVNHRLFNLMQDSTLCRVIQNLLSNRSFYMELNNKRSRWRLQKNGLTRECSLPNSSQHIHQ